MSQKWKACLIGCACSLLAVGLWIFLSVVLGLLAGLAGALMGILFLLPYKKLNPDDRSNFPYVAGAIVIVIEVFVSELISLAIIGAAEGFSLAELLQSQEIINAFILDVVLGLVLSAVVFGGYIFDVKRKEKRAAAERNRAALAATEYAATNPAEPGAIADPVGGDAQARTSETAGIERLRLRRPKPTPNAPVRVKKTRGVSRESPTADASIASAQNATGRDAIGYESNQASPS